MGVLEQGYGNSKILTTFECSAPRFVNDSKSYCTKSNIIVCLTRFLSVWSVFFFFFFFFLHNKFVMSGH